MALSSFRSGYEGTALSRWRERAKTEPSLAVERLVAERRRLAGRQSRDSDLYETEAGGFVTSVAGGGELAIRARETGRVFRLDRFVKIFRGRPHRIHIRLVAIWIKGLRKADAGPDLLHFVVRERPVLHRARIPQLEMPELR